MSIYHWSQTAASNGNSDPAINMTEGMAPSQVNDGYRAGMAVIRKYVDDISGAIATGGTSTAYTVTSFSVFSSLSVMNGQMIAFTPHATNTGTVTLNVDGLGAKPLRGSPSVELPSGSLILGTPYVATYNNSDAVWYLQGGFSNPYNIPLCAGIDYYGSTAPNSAFVFPYGQAISRTTYATAYALLGTAFGAGDGSTTFNLPDKRGCVSAMQDNVGTGAAGRLTGAFASIVGAQTNTLILNNLPPITPTGTVTGTFSGSGSGTAGNGQAANGNGAGPSVVPTFINGVGNASTLAVSVTVSGNISATFTGNSFGASTPVNNLQPTLIVNHIIRII